MFAIKRSKNYLILYRLLQLIFIPFLKLVYRVEVINQKKSSSIPNGGLVLCCNHISALDPIVLCSFFPRPVYFMSKIELFRNKFVRAILGFVNSFPVNRSGVGRTSIAKAAEVLKAGSVFGIFPEGHRSIDGEIGDTRRGVGLVAYLGKAPILPIAIYNSKKDPRKNINKKKYLFLKVKIVFGELIDTKAILSKYPKKEAIAIISDLVMDEIKMLYSKFE
ncbi:MAG: lysophospholipid acyltransferase family protein [Candidatus Humimicrobiaceae bacterium]